MKYMHTANHSHPVIIKHICQVNTIYDMMGFHFVVGPAGMHVLKELASFPL
jgi:hypothetical protein